MKNLNFIQNELLDVVDENDNIVDSVSRIEIHKLGLLHREIHVWLFDEEKNIFFQKRGRAKGSAGLLDASVGGHVDRGENYIEAAIRELEEEAGIVATQEDLIFLNTFRGNYKNETKGTINNFFRHVFVYRNSVIDSQLKKENDFETYGFEKYSIKELNSIQDPNNIKFLQFILKDEIRYLVKWLNNQP